jgi:probable DNA metabolism protein
VFVATVEPPWSLDAWRDQARMALGAGIAPEHLQWQAGAQAGLALGGSLRDQPQVHAIPRVPAALIELAEVALCHRDGRRHGWLYRLLWRVTHGEPALLERATDPDVVAVHALSQAVRRDSHKMKAFVRFRALPVDDAYVAWFEPDHCIVDRVAPFFSRRFAGMRWAILTPYRSVRWDGARLSYGPGGVRSDAPAEDAQDDLWRTYYANIFNPARLNPTMMRKEMPQKYWKGLPEARQLPALLANAGSRVRTMAERAPQPPRRRIPVASPAVEPQPQGGLAELRAAAAACRRCELWAPATQTVFGEGPENARVMIVGEQPGDEEDLVGRPFVGPAGKLFDRALAEIGLDRGALYVTNAVKHFRFERRGKVRLHRNPEQAQVRACHDWLEREIAAVRPEIIVCLGATAAKALFGSRFRLLEERGTWRVAENGIRAFATIHPSWVLRQRTPHDKAQAYRGFVDDLSLLKTSSPEPDSAPV